MLAQIVLNDANVLKVFDVLVEAGLEGHVLCTDGEAFGVLGMVTDEQEEGDASGMSLHQSFHHGHGQVDTFHDHGLSSSLEAI